MEDVESTMRHAIVEEEGIPIETVTNFEEVRKEIIFEEDSMKCICLPCNCDVAYSLYLSTDLLRAKP